MLSYTDVSVYLIISLTVDERKIDVRKPAKVPKGQEGESLKSPTHSSFIMHEEIRNDSRSCYVVL